MTKKKRNKVKKTIISAIVVIFSGIGVPFFTHFLNENDSGITVGDINIKEKNIENKDSSDNINISGDMNGEIIVNNWEAVEKDNRQEEIIESEPSYLKCLEELVDEDIVYSEYNDFDNDGVCEMFALVGKEEEELDNIKGELWFVNCNGAKKIEYRKKFYWSNPHIFWVKKQLFLTLEEAYATGSFTYIWSVKAGKPYQPNLSGRGNGLNLNKFGEIELTASITDAGKIEGMNFRTGRTWKKYFFYYDGKNFREYGGIEIDWRDIANYKGIDGIRKSIKEHGYSIDNILYRGNGVYHINLYKKDKNMTEYYNISFRYLKKVSVFQGEIDKIYYGGTYHAAYIPSLATYPKSIGI